MNGFLILPTDKDLLHHGRLGQKWGQRNGPPYPLGLNKQQYSALSRFGKGAAKHIERQDAISQLKAEKKLRKENKKADRVLKKAKAKEAKNARAEQKALERKEAAVRHNSYKELYAIKDNLSYKELQDAFNRIDLEQKIFNKANPKQPGLMDTIDKAVNNIDRVGRWVDKGTNTWNTFATIYNNQDAVKNGKAKPWKFIDKEINKKQKDDDKDKKKD